MANIDFKALAPDVGRLLLGEPNERLSSGKELRFGTNGSLSLSLVDGAYFDFEGNQGGGLLDLIKRETNSDPMQWLIDNRFISDTRNAGEVTFQFTDLTAPVNSEGSKQDREHIYTNEHGEPLYRVQVRYSDDGKKAVYLNRFDAEKGVFVKGMEGVIYAPYNLPELITRPDDPVYICEGEKDCDNLKALGLLASCNVAGALKWDSQADQLNPYFKGRDVVILCDNDEVGLKHGHNVAAHLLSLANSVKLIDISRYWADMPPKADISDALAAGATLADVLEMVSNAPFYGSKDKDFLAGTAINESWFEREPPPRPTIIDGLLPKGITAILGGAGGLGKSSLALQMAACVAAGYPFLGRNVYKGKVLFLSAEDDRTEIQRRLFKFVELNSIDCEFGDIQPINKANLVKNLMVKDLAGDGLLLTRTVEGVAVVSPDVDKIEQSIKSLDDLRLIVVDTYSRLNGGKENSNEDAATFVKACERLSKSTGATVLILAHMTKGAAGVDGIAGGKRFTDSARLAMVIKGRFYDKTADEVSGIMQKLGEPLENFSRYIRLTVEKDNYCGNLGRFFDLRRIENSATLEQCDDPLKHLSQQEGGLMGEKELKQAARNAAIREGLKILIDERNRAGDIITRNAIRNNYAGTNGRLSASWSVIAPVLQDMLDDETLRGEPIQPKGEALYVVGGIAPPIDLEGSKEKAA